MSTENPQHHKIHYLIKRGQLVLCDQEGASCGPKLDVTLLPDSTCIRFEVDASTHSGGEYQVRASLVQEGAPEKPLKHQGDGILLSEKIRLGADGSPVSPKIKLALMPLGGPGTSAKPPTTVVIETKICAA